MWFMEWFSECEFHGHKVKRILAASKTPFQSATLIETNAFGKCLIIDNETQSSELDEYIYHESLVCPALIIHPNPSRALILGGGEGATAREILNSNTIKKAVMVDIDYAILEFAKKYMKEWHRKAFEDDRLSVLVQDAKNFVEKTSVKFDVIYSDLPSPEKGGPAFELYTNEFYKSVKRILDRNGIFVTQAGPGIPSLFQLHEAMHATLSSVFNTVRSYFAYIPSYDMTWSFLFCTDSAKLDPLLCTGREMDDIIEKRLRTKLKFLDGAAIEGVFRIPKYYRERIKANRKIITRNRPVFFTTYAGLQRM